MSRCSGWFATLLLLSLSGRSLEAQAPKATGDAAFFKVRAPGGWVMLPDLVTLIVSLPEEAKLVYFDTLTNRIARKVEVDFKPGPLALQGDRLYAGAAGSALVYALDVKRAKTLKEFAIPRDAVARLACHPKSGLVYASTASLKVFSLDPQGGSVTTT